MVCIFYLRGEKKAATKRSSAPQSSPLRGGCSLMSSLCLPPPPRSLMTFLKVAKESFGLPWELGASKNWRILALEGCGFTLRCSGSRVGYRGWGWGGGDAASSPADGSAGGQGGTRGLELLSGGTQGPLEPPLPPWFRSHPDPNIGRGVKD